ncbi:MAG TPA: HAD-IA family hydrolase, partial [Steroidobacteraceae bacterium]|nr:HAD-IA family hydrolase [Steroidobacteraceae bacterium]
VALRPGVRELMGDCGRDGIPMAIVTTTSRGNAEALLRVSLGDDWSWRFATIIDAENAPRKKPDPQAYHVALQRLGLSPHEAVAIEDSPAGLESARAAGIPVVLARSRFFADAPAAGAIASGPGLDTTVGWAPAPLAQRGRIDLAQIRTWHGSAIDTLRRH